MTRDSFVFYKSFYDAIKQIPEEYQLEIYNAILQYSLEGVEPSSLSNIASAMFTLIKPNIDSAQKKYEVSVNNGRRGGRPKKEELNENQNETQEKPNENQNKTQEKPNENQNETQEEPNENLNVNDNDNVNDIIINNSEEASLYDKEAEKIQKVIIETLGTTNLNNIKECVNYLDKLPYELIEYALKKTARIERPCWKYTITILEGYITKKIKTVEEAKADDLKYKTKKNSSQDESEKEKQQRKIKELEEIMNANK